MFFIVFLDNQLGNQLYSTLFLPIADLICVVGLFYKIGGHYHHSAEILAMLQLLLSSVLPLV